MPSEPPFALGVLVSGRGSTLRALARAIDEGRLAAEIRIVGADRRDAPAVAWAESAGLDVLVVPPPPRGPEDGEALLAQGLRMAGVELVVLAGYLRILKGPLLEAFPERIINTHPSLLPAFGGPGMYGRHVHRAVLASGAKTTGATVHLVTSQVDRGPVLAQRALPVLPGEDAEALAERLLPVEHELLVEVLQNWRSRASKRPE